jgi:peptidoglycan/xylan/chitin deacetylase (PgdA/CDA1 family)
MALEREHDVRSTFYFVPSTSSGSRDPAYDIADPEVSSIIGRLQEAGWEVAVHGSFQSYADASQLIYERHRLADIAGVELWGIRQHYLRLMVPQTFRAQAKAGLVYDASLGYPDVLGFRAGAASPFWVFDAQDQRQLPLLELPLTVMEGALFWDLGCESQEAVQHTLELLNTVRQVQGLGTLLWHQRVWDVQRYPGWGDAYAALLQYVRNEGEAWVVPACEVAMWWQARRSLLQNSLCSSRFQLTYHPSQNIEEVCLDVYAPPERTLRLKAGRGEVRVLSKHHVEVRIDKLSAGDGLELEFIA